MILPALTALLTAVGPLLRGAWDLWAQSILELAIIGGFSGWLIFRIFVGFLPLPSRRLALWIASLVLLGSLSVWMSPVRGLVRTEWHIYAAALWVFLAMPAISKNQRFYIDEAIRVGGWVLVALAFYQHYAFHEQRPTSALINQNAFAGAILLLLPLAIEKKDWLLVFGLLCNLAWARSVGAWLGLAIALGLTQRRSSPFWFWIGSGLGMVCSILIYAKFGSPETLHRWAWWKAAARMAYYRPWVGYGPGSFAYVLPSVADHRSGGLLSMYAHQYPLQLFAEFGFIFGILWLGGLWHFVARKSSMKSFGVMAIFFHSLWDYPLAIPSNLWLMSYFAASSIPENQEGLNIPSRHKFPLALLVAGLCLCLFSTIKNLWDGQKMMASSMESSQAGRLEEAVRWIEMAKNKTPGDPEVFLASSELNAKLGNRLQAASDMESAVRINPFSPGYKDKLMLAYRNLIQSVDAKSVPGARKNNHRQKS